MAVDEFEELIMRCGLQNDMLVQREIGVCFNQSMMSYVDELSQDKHLRMTFVEFLEAMARAADQASFPPQIP